jgi:hypothetical protein
MRLLKVACGAAVLAACSLMFAPDAHADEWDKKTILTFSGPVQIPGATLPAGTYVFKLADLSGNRHVVQVFDKSEKKIFGTMMAIPRQRINPSDKPVVLFSERPTGSPQALRVWYYPGETIGNEFVYPKSQAIAIAKATHQPVLSTDTELNGATDAERMNAMKTTTVGHYDENGRWVVDGQTDSTVATSTPGTAPAPTPAPRVAESTPAPTPTRSTSAVGTSGQRPTRKHLPRTASNLALYELLSGFAVLGGLSLRQLRKRTAETR